MGIKNRNLFRLTRFVLLRMPPLFKFLAKFRTPKKRLLIIKTDAIGDYILFRNFIEVVKTSERFKHYQVDLLGNILWQEIALKYDGGFIDNFYFINADELYEAPWRTLKLGWRLFRNNYQIVLQPAYARTFINDGIAGLTAAKEIVGFEGDTERINRKYKVKTDTFYTRLLHLHAVKQFEFDRVKYFFETLLGQRLAIAKPKLGAGETTKNGVLIFPGAGVLKRSWEPEKFLELIKRIIKHTSKQIILAGGPDEIRIGAFLMNELPPGRVTNRIAGTSLIELIGLVAGSEILISNETSAIHIAVAVNTKAVCILGGGHFGRFAPYPENIGNTPLCLFEKMDCFNCNWHCIYKTAENEPFPCISAISLEKVWAEVKAIL